MKINNKQINIFKQHNNHLYKNKNKTFSNYITVK